MDPLLHPEYLLLLLEQGERSLKGHTRLFLVLANLSSYPDDALYAFYDASLNSAYRASLAEEGPRANFDTFFFRVDSAIPDPVSSPPSPHCTEHMLSPPLTESQDRHDRQAINKPGARAGNHTHHEGECRRQ